MTLDVDDTLIARLRLAADMLGGYQLPLSTIVGAVIAEAVEHYEVVVDTRRAQVVEAMRDTDEEGEL